MCHGVIFLTKKNGELVGNEAKLPGARPVEFDQAMLTALEPCCAHLKMRVQYPQRASMRVDCVGLQ